MYTMTHKEHVFYIIKLWQGRLDPKKYPEFINAVEQSYSYCVLMPDFKIHFGYFLDDLIFRYNRINKSDVSIDEVQKLLVLL